MMGNAQNQFSRQDLLLIFHAGWNGVRDAWDPEMRGNHSSGP